MQLARERVEEALELLNDALRSMTAGGQAADVGGLCRAAGVLSSHLGRPRDTVRYYEQLLQVAPEDPYLRWALGDTYAELGEAALSTLHWDRFVQMAGASADPALQEMLAAHRARRGTEH